MLSVNVKAKKLVNTRHGKLACLILKIRQTPSCCVLFQTNSLKKIRTWLMHLFFLMCLLCICKLVFQSGNVVRHGRRSLLSSLGSMF